MPFKKTSQTDYRWKVAHIIVRKAHIEIGCGGPGAGGFIDEALPTIQMLVMRLNQIMDRAGVGKPCELHVNGNYAYLMNLEGYSFLAAGIFIGMLLDSNWQFGEVNDYRKMDPPPANPKYWDTMAMQRIYMNRW